MNSVLLLRVLFHICLKEVVRFLVRTSYALVCWKSFCLCACFRLSGCCQLGCRGRRFSPPVPTQSDDTARKPQDWGRNQCTCARNVATQVTYIQFWDLKLPGQEWTRSPRGSRTCSTPQQRTDDFLFPCLKKKLLAASNIQKRIKRQIYVPCNQRKEQHGNDPVWTIAHPADDNFTRLPRSYDQYWPVTWWRVLTKIKDIIMTAYNF